MAKLPALIELIAKYDPRGAATVENYARKLRAGGIMMTGKRGVGAPEMTVRDATSLLLSMVCRRADEVAESVSALRNAKIEPYQEQDIREFAFYERTKDENGTVRAGLFLDCLLEDHDPRHLIIGGEEHMLDAVEVYDPKTGFGRIVATFSNSDSVPTRIAFNALDMRVDDQSLAPPFKIQNSILIPMYIITKTRLALKQADAA